MKFSYKESFTVKNIDAYEKVLLDILLGDQMLFNRSDEMQSSWALITHILKGWEQKKAAPYIYERGSWGPKEAFTLLEADGRSWL
jgi:glucose-6-phosphate 1-dehydrogenase